MTAVLTLWRRELTRFYRERSRVVGALTPPVLFWFLIGSGLGGSFSTPGGMSYLHYFYSGTLVLIVLFTSIFATISIIEDRREGFLQTVLIAPVPRLHIVLGKVLGGATVGLLQGLCFLALAPLAGIGLTLTGFAAAFAALSLCAVGLTALGFIIAWKLDSTQGFHAVMNLFLMPLWLLSGALFPYATAPAWLRAVMKANPVTYAVAALRQALAPGHPDLASLPACLLVLAAFGAAMLAAAAGVASRRDER